MINVCGVTKFFGEKAVLKDVSFSLAPGELVGLIGPSGGGKSVLLKIMANVLDADIGKVDYTYDSPSEGEKRKDRQIGFLFQEGALFDSLSLLENVAFPLRVKKDTTYLEDSECGDCVDRETALERAYQILCDVGLKDAWKKFPGQISGGMRRRVGIARALVSSPDLVLLDDPTGGLDPVAASVIMGLIKELHDKYSPTIVLSSHDIRRLIPAVTRLISLFDGRIISDCPISDLLQKAPQNVIDFLKTRYDFAPQGLTP